eukprot:scaffold86439_cov29-Tisochrysis_lutea.AAC.3
MCALRLGLESDEAEAERLGMFCLLILPRRDHSAERQRGEEKGEAVTGVEWVGLQRRNPLRVCRTTSALPH